MSENQGIHYTLTGDASSFISELNNAANSLENFATQASELKNEEENLKNNINSLTSAVEKKKQALSNAEKKLSEYESSGKKNQKTTETLKGKISELKTKIETLNSSISTNKSKLDSITNSQKQVADQVRNTKEQIDNLAQSYEKNSRAASANQSANESVTNSLKTGISAIKAFALSQGAKTLYDALIGSNADFEQHLTSFEVLLQSGEKAEKMISDLDKLGADTPFELTDLTSATEQLLAFGTAEEDVMTRLNQLGDLSKGKADILERITLAYGKMQAKGKVSLEELNMMTEAGVPILRELADQLNITTDALFSKITKGEININNINKAMESMTSEGGQFYGMMEKQSQTMEGLMSTASDNINIALRDIGAGAFESLKSEITDVLGTLRQMSEDGSLKDFAESAGEKISTVVNILLTLVNVVYNMRGVLLTGAKAWLTYKTAINIISTVKTLRSAFSGLKSALQTVSAAHKTGIHDITRLKSATLAETVAAKTDENAQKSDAIATKANTASKNEQTVATEKQTAAQKVFNSVMNTNPLGLAIASTVTLISVIGSVISKVQQAEKESRRAAIQAGEDAKNHSEEVNSLIKEYKELATAGDWDNSSRERAREIQQQLNSLVGAEAEGLNDSNKELKERLDILEKISLEEAKDNQTALFDAEQAAGKELYSTIWKNNNAGRTGISIHVGRKDSLEELEKIKEIYNNSGFLSERRNGSFDLSFTNGEHQFETFLDKYPKLIDLQKQLYDSNLQNTQSYKNLSKVINEFSEDYNTYISALSAWQENDATVHIGEYMKENSIATQEEFDAYINKVKESTDVSEQYKQVLTDVANKTFPQFSNSVADTNKNVSETAESAKKASETVDKLKSLSDSFSSLNEAQGEINKSGKMNVSTIAEIKEKFAGLGESCDEYIERLIKANGNSKETKKIFSEMTDALISQTMSTEDLANADVNLIAQMLKEAGVANSLETAVKLVNKAKYEVKIKTIDFTDATAEEVKQLFSEAETAGVAKNKLIELIREKVKTNSTQIKTQDDIEQLINLARHAGATAESLENLRLAKEALARQSEIASSFSSPLSSLPNSQTKVPYDFGEASRKKAIEDAKKAAEDDAFKKILNGEIDFDPLKNDDYTDKSSSAKYSGKSDKSSSSKSSKTSAANTFKQAKQKEDEQYSRLLDSQLGYDQISEKEWNLGQKERAKRYRAWAQEVKNLASLTAEERLTIYEDFIDKAEDLELSAYKKEKSLLKTEYEKDESEREDAFSKRFETSENWIDDTLEQKLYEDVYDGYERMREYTNSFYKDEKEKLKEAFNKGLYSQEEYNQKAETLAESHVKSINKINDGVEKSLNNEFDNYISTAKEYISDRNFYNDWDAYNDSEDNAYSRMFETIDEFRERGISSNKWMSALSEISKTFYTRELENAKQAAEKEVEILKSKYQAEYDMKKENAEKELALAKEKAEKEKETINDTYDNEIKRINELIEKRKQAREDEDYDLKLSRLQTKLAYEHDEDNRRALEKEIKNLKQEREDTLFDRQMEELKEKAEINRDSALKKVESELVKAEKTAERKASVAEDDYNFKINDSAIISAEVKKKLNFGSYATLASVFNNEFSDGLLRGLQGIITGINNAVTTVDNSNKTNNFNLYANYATSQSPKLTTAQLRSFLEQLELELRL